MLGMRQNDAPITGEFARNIRMQLWRIADDKRNSADQQMGSIHEQAARGQQYQISWSI